MFRSLGRHGREHDCACASENIDEVFVLGIEGDRRRGKASIIPISGVVPDDSIDNSIDSKSFRDQINEDRSPICIKSGARFPCFQKTVAEPAHLVPLFTGYHEGRRDNDGIGCHALSFLQGLS